MTTLVDLSFKANTSDLDKAQAALDATQKKTKELDNAIDSFVSSISKASGAMLDFEKSSGKVGSALKDVATSFNPVKLAVGGLTAAIAGFSLSGLKSMVSGVIESAAELNNLSTKTGITVEQLSIMKSVAAQSGTSMDVVTGAVMKFEKAIATSSNATSVQAKAFKELGINTSDTSKTTEDYMSMAAEKLSGLEDGWQKNNIVMALFGKTGTDVNEFLADYANRGDMAAKVTKQEAEEAENYERSMKKLSATANQYKTLLGMGLLPVMSNITDELLKSMSASGKLDAETKKLIKNEVAEWGFAFAKGIAAAIDVGIAFFNLLRGLGTALGTFGGAVSTAFSLLSDLVSGKISISDYLSKAKDNAIQFGQGMKSAWQIASQDSSKYYDIVTRAETNYRENLTKTTKEVKRRTPGNIGDADANKSGAAKATEADKETDALKRYTEELQKRLAAEKQLTTEETARQLIERQYPQATKEIKDQALALAKQVDELERKNILEKQAKAISGVGSSAAKKIDDELRARRLSTAQIERERVAEQLDLKVKESIDALRQKGLNTLEAEVQLRQEATAALAEYDAAVERKKVADQDWFTNGAKEYEKSFGDVNDSLKSITSNGFKGFEDGLVSLATTGKMNFKDFAASMISDILRMIIQMTVMKSLMSAIGFGNGGAFSGGSTITTQAMGGAWTSGVQAYADGGVVSSPTLFGMAGNRLGLMGEAGPEAIMPLRRGADGKLGVAAAGSSSTTVYSPTIQISVGTVDSTDRIAEMESRITKAMEATANKAIATQARKGGMLNPVR